MSALQLWLLALGLLLLAGLAAHGAWRTRRSRPRRPQRTAPRPGEAAGPGEPPAPRREPGFDSLPPQGAEALAELPGAGCAEGAGPVPGSGLALDLLSGAEAPAPWAARFGASAASADREPADLPAEPGPTPAPAPVEPELLPALRRREGPRIDLRIDCPATLRLNPPLSGEALLAHLPASRRVGSKPLLIEASPPTTPTPAAPPRPAPAEPAPWDAPADAPQALADPAPTALALAAESPPEPEVPHWESPRPGMLYGGLRLAVQLASRSGALNEIEFSEFAQKVEGLADTLQASFELPDMREAVDRARSLDAFASAHDALLSLQLRARRAAWTPGFVQQQARALGLSHGVLPGRMVLPAREAGAPPQLVLQMDAQAALADDPERAAVRELTLSLDVPQTPQQHQPFEAWVRLAGQLAEALEAEVCDDLGQPLGPPAFEAIRASLAQLYAELEAAELPAGSVAARRLFA